MTNSWRHYALQKKSAEECFPFAPDVPVYKVGGKMFALYFTDKQREYINVKCDPEEGLQLRTVFSEITAGYHMNKKHWITVDLSGEVPKGEVQRLIDRSYELVVKGLPAKVRKLL